MIILGVDPGIGRVGWSFVEEISGTQKLLDYGCLETDPKHSDEMRLIHIHDFFTGLLDKVTPDVAAIESLFFASNAKTAFSVGQARGVIVLTISQLHIPITSYTPLQVKQTVSGYGRAEKKQMQLMVQSIFKMDKIIKPDDAADAVAIALTHAFSYKLTKRLENRNRN